MLLADAAPRDIWYLTLFASCFILVYTKRYGPLKSWFWSWILVLWAHTFYEVFFYAYWAWTWNLDGIDYRIIICELLLSAFSLHLLRKHHRPAFNYFKDMFPAFMSATFILTIPGVLQWEHVFFGHAVRLIWYVLMIKLASMFQESVKTKSEKRETEQASMNIGVLNYFDEAGKPQRRLIRVG